VRFINVYIEYRKYLIKSFHYYYYYIAAVAAVAAAAAAAAVAASAFFKEFSLGGQNRKKMQNEKYEPSRFG
jgi:hypothetical protein